MALRHVKAAIFTLLIVTIAGGARAGGIIDKAMSSSAPGDSILWFDIRLFGVEGRGWDDTKGFYDRLPAKAENMVRKPVWHLGRDSAGMCVRFVTDATKIQARWDLTSENLDMPHFPATGVSGLDLYVKTYGDHWRWLGVGRPEHFPVNTVTLARGIPREKREYLLYLPLYNGVSTVEIGIGGEFTLETAEPRPADRKPMVFYGTSITQGGCASRSGMVHTAILGRWLNYPVINLGFSGNGRMEQEMADLLAELDPSVYVLDCVPNMNPDMVRERVEPFVKTLRKARPNTPILLVEDRNYTNSWLVQSARAHNTEDHAELRKAYFRLLESGIRNLHYLPGDHLLGHDDEATVGGSHPTDLGFMRQARAFRDALRPILGIGTVILDEEWLRTAPDITVFIPKGYHDGDNEHFDVFEAPKSAELLAIWTQSSVEGRGDNRAVIARSLDGKLWSEPSVIVGKGPGRNDHQASWAFPIVSKTGRIYCFYTKEIEKIDARQSSGVMGCVFSDDNGYTWIRGTDIPVPKNKYDNPDPAIPPNWIVWQKPIRDGKGNWIAGMTRVTSETVMKKPSPNWTDVDSRSAFVRFENIDDGPAPEDLKIAWLPKDSEGIEVPHKTWPKISVAQEPAVALLPDGRLFTVMRTMTGYAWYSVSDDDGETWREPEVLRYRDEGREIPNPMAPSPLYRLADGRYLFLFYNNTGKRGKYDQFRKKWKTNQLNHLRNPAWIAVGEFRPDAHQPLWFSAPKVLLDSEDVVFGPKGTASVGTYPSLTEWHGKRVLWYPDRKHFLLGKYLPDELLKDMTVPR
ncbi:MAG: exo-alpha-sialidase [Candidatus Latescibacteria bacterium]|nr:exo-alpha-sialidase [Candidatus Latescibacterota bacterium]